MNEELAQRTLSRLRAVDWDDWDTSASHARSRAVLMREYMRRIALWAESCDAQDVWPFFDLSEYIDGFVGLEPDLEGELEEFVSSCVSWDSVKKTCRGAVRWAGLDADVKAKLPDLPDPYEPLLLMYERGGGFSVGPLIDLNGAMIPLWSREHVLATAPPATLDLATLDGLDA